MPRQKRPRTTRATPGRVRGPYTTYAPPRAASRRRATSAPSWLGWLRLGKRSSTPPTAPRPRSRIKGRVGLDLRAGASWARALIVRSGERRHRPTSRAGASSARPRNALPPPIAKPLPQHPDRRRLHLHPALMGLLLAQIALVALAVWGLTSPTWQVRHIRVEGTSDPVLLHAIQGLPLTGCNIFRCDLARPARQVERLPLVAHAVAHASYPDTLVIVVTPRRPAVLWQTGAGDIVLALDGTVLGPPQSDPAFTHPSLPPIADDQAALFGGQLPHAGQSISALVVEMAGQLRMAIAGALGDGWALRYTSDHGFAAQSDDGRQVLFGTPADAAQSTQTSAQTQALPSLAPPTPQAVGTGVGRQLAELRALLTQLQQSGQRATLIDLRWGAHPYYRTDG